LQGDPIVGYYTSCLDRYRAGKPWHRLTVLEEMGLRRTRPSVGAAPPDSGVQRAGGSGAIGSGR
jgi:hypothetical protein